MAIGGEHTLFLLVLDSNFDNIEIEDQGNIED
jgi:hypothetical protein